MPLVIEENLTGNLAPMLREGELDVVIIALPFAIPGVTTDVVYEEPFNVVVPEGHRWQVDEGREARRALRGEPARPAKRPTASATRCSRACPGRRTRRCRKGRAGSSLETIRNMVPRALA
jgi:LysR family hydrogen peroxide-inducible transcriptional activator